MKLYSIFFNVHINKIEKNYLNENCFDFGLFCSFLLCFSVYWRFLIKVIIINLHLYFFLLEATDNTLYHANANAPHEPLYRMVKTFLPKRLTTEPERNGLATFLILLMLLLFLSLASLFHLLIYLSHHSLRRLSIC